MMSKKCYSLLSLTSYLSLYTALGSKWTEKYRLYYYKYKTLFMVKDNDYMK